MADGNREWTALSDQRPEVGAWVELMKDGEVLGPFCWSNGLLDQLGSGYIAWRPSW